MLSINRSRPTTGLSPCPPPKGLGSISPESRFRTLRLASTSAVQLLRRDSKARLAPCYAGRIRESSVLSGSFWSNPGRECMEPGIHVPCHVTAIDCRRVVGGAELLCELCINLSPGLGWQGVPRQAQRAIVNGQPAQELPGVKTPALMECITGIAGFRAQQS